jgi:hypothetical protein
MYVPMTSISDLVRSDAEEKVCRSSSALHGSQPAACCLLLLTTLPLSHLPPLGPAHDLLVAALAALVLAAQRRQSPPTFAGPLAPWPLRPRGRPWGHIFISHYI